MRCNAICHRQAVLPVPLRPPFPKRPPSLPTVLLLGLLLSGASSAGSDIQHSDIRVTPLSAAERVRADAWELTDTEWQRYRSLLQGVRGSVSPVTLSPLEVLGIHARDADERTRYAERWALAMHDDAERILAFQHAYDEASRRLFPQLRLIDAAALPKRPEATLLPTDRILVFVRPACPACETLLARVLAVRNKVAGIDIFVADFADDASAVRAWASNQPIDPTWVRNRTVTLNFAAGDNHAAIPYLMRRRGAMVTPLAPTVF